MYWHAWRLPPEPPPPGVPAAAQGWWALRFTPRVALLDEALLLEVQGTERLWGGRAALRALLRAQASGSGPEAAQDWAEGPTALQALALLRLARLGGPPPRRLPHDLPLATLTALRPHALALQHLGCRTWGALRALPRAGVARRFGAACLAALDQAWGDAPEAAAWIELPAQFALEVELPALAESSTALLHTAERLLLALQGWLRARRQGVLALELAWRHDLRRHDGVALPPWQALALRTAAPQQDMAHLRRLLAERLGRQRLAAPASRLALRSLQTAPMPEASHGLLPADPHEAPGVPWQELVERLSARLGPQAVQMPRLHADHRPECMQRWHPAVQPPPGAAPEPPGPYGGLLPPWLVRPPRPLALRGSRPCLHGQPLRLLAGPQRVEAGWWEAAPEAAQDAAGSAAPGLVRRDYFVAHSAAAGWVWVFRDRGTGGWFLHGVYG
ncbi:DNA polymerase Y family protein [Acidovorax sp. YS12]|nr:DNA polymerase Y family protein [Acidovorax sp. YS12]